MILEIGPHLSVVLMVATVAVVTIMVIRAILR